MSTAVPRPGPPLASRLWFNVFKCCSSERPFFEDIRNTFSVMSYNILSDTLMRRNQYLYPHCPAQHANWKYRNSRLKRTIAEYAPDVLCINELEPSVFKEWKRHNIFRNYRAFYIKRTDSEIEEYPDGEAIFVSRKKFKVLECSPVSLNVNELSDRGNVALVLMCQYISDDKAMPRLVCFATTHLLFNPRRGFIKLAQLQGCLDLIRSQVLKYRKSHSVDVPVVFCGDFNLVPYSVLYDFLQTGKCTLFDSEEKSMSKFYKTTFQLSKRQRLSKRVSRQTHLHMSTSSGSMSYEYDVAISSVIGESSATFSHIVGSTRKRTFENTTAAESIIPPSFRYRDPNRGRMYEIPHAVYHAFAFKSVYEPYFFTNKGHLLGSSIHARTTDFVDFIFYGNLLSSLNGEQLGYQKWSDSFIRALGRGYVLGDSFHHSDIKDLDSTVPNEESLVMRSLEPLEYVRLPNKLEPLPNQEEPSDHFFVMCRFLLTDGCDEK